MNLNNISIRHNPNEQMILIKLYGGIAHLKYDEPKSDVLIIKETYVPKESRNNGVAVRLVEYALDLADKHNKQVIPSCTFAEEYLENHPEHNDIIYDK